jgi:hypothetical protein
MADIINHDSKVGAILAPALLLLDSGAVLF